MTVRPARLDDTEAVLAVWGTARSAAAVTPDTPESVARVVGAGALLVAEGNEGVVGVLVAGWDGWRGNLYRLAVLPAHRRRGAARALVEAGHARLRALGAVRVTALVGRGEEDAEALWEAVGCTRDDDIARFVRNL